MIMNQNIVYSEAIIILQEVMLLYEFNKTIILICFSLGFFHEG